MSFSRLLLDTITPTFMEIIVQDKELPPAGSPNEPLESDPFSFVHLPSTKTQVANTICLFGEG